jgi:HicB family
MIQLRLQPEVEAQLAAEARDHGLPLDRYIAKIVEARPSARQTGAERRKAVEAMMDFTKKHSTTLGGLDLKGMIHQGHKY